MTKPPMTVAIVFLLIVVGAVAAPQPVLAQDSDAEKRVTFYTTYAFQKDNVWTIPLRVWVHEAPGFAGRLAARVARSEVQRRARLDELSDEQVARFETVATGFIADSESRESVRFVFDDDPESIIYQLRGDDGRRTTDRNGLLQGTINLTPEKASLLLQAQESVDDWLSFRAISDNHYGRGRVQLISPQGVSVVSDVDDTIKVTEIPVGEEAVLRNTFFRDFRAAPCMAEMYTDVADGASFHYVSGGPWQMYQPLADFVFSPAAGFPRGSFHMKDVRTNPFESESYQDIWKLVAAGSQQVTFEQKVMQITELLQRFPEREFILIGDSGERDPEVFAEIRRSFGPQIREIRIRDVVGALEHEPERLAGMMPIADAPDEAGLCAPVETPGLP